MRNNLSTPLIIQSRTILYYYTSKLLLPSKSRLFAYKLVCIEQPGRPGCNKKHEQKFAYIPAEKGKNQGLKGGINRDLS